MNKVIATAAAVIFALSGTLIASPTAMASWIQRAAQSIERSHEIPLTAFAPNTSYAVCFTPGQDCEGLIVSEIRWHNVCPYSPSQSKISSAEMPHLCDCSIRTTL